MTVIAGIDLESHIVLAADSRAVNRANGTYSLTRKIRKIGQCQLAISGDWSAWLALDFYARHRDGRDLSLLDLDGWQDFTEHAWRYLKNERGIRTFGAGFVSEETQALIASPMSGLLLLDSDGLVRSCASGVCQVGGSARSLAAGAAASRSWSELMDLERAELELHGVIEAACKLSVYCGDPITIEVVPKLTAAERFVVATARVDTARSLVSLGHDATTVARLVNVGHTIDSALGSGRL